MSAPKTAAIFPGPYRKTVRVIKCFLALRSDKLRCILLYSFALFQVSGLFQIIFKIACNPGGIWLNPVNPSFKIS